MKTFGSIAPALAGLLGLGAPARAQSPAPAPTALVATAVAAAQQQYNDSFGAHPQLYNGPEYVDYARRYNERIGHQFFLAPDKQPGSVYYNDHYFKHLRLAYDVVLDQLVLQHPTSPLTLRLANEQVRSFSINGHRFVRLQADSSAGGVIATGYYELLADGRVQVLARRAKRLREQLSQRLINAEFVSVDRFFIQKGGTYYAVSGKSAVTKLLADHAKEVQQFMRDKNLSFKKDQLGSSLAQVATYYNGLL
jgi:hypothetical protein